MFILAFLLVSSFTVRGDTLYVEGPQVVVIDDAVEVIKPSWEKIHEPEPIYRDIISIEDVKVDTLIWDYFDKPIIIPMHSAKDHIYLEPCPIKW